MHAFFQCVLCFTHCKELKSAIKSRVPEIFGVILWYNTHKRSDFTDDRCLDSLVFLKIYNIWPTLQHVIDISTTLPSKAPAPPLSPQLCANHPSHLGSVLHVILSWTIYISLCWTNGLSVNVGWHLLLVLSGPSSGHQFPLRILLILLHICSYPLCLSRHLPLWPIWSQYDDRLLPLIPLTCLSNIQCSHHFQHPHQLPPQHCPIHYLCFYPPHATQHALHPNIQPLY